jgi:cytochrome c oxidase subunit 3
MQQEIKIEEPDFRIHPKKVVLWVSMVSIVMIFAALSSALMVRQGEGNWNYFKMPPMFWITSGLILLSSVTMQWSLVSLKRESFPNLVTGLWITALLGVAFLAGQFIGWMELVNMGVFFRDNPSNSFLYILTGLHGLHLIGGLIAVIWVLVKAILFRYRANKMLGVELCATYWHFMGALWIYLFLFLLYHYS